ncbi:uncharacterized protein TNCV_339801 [Trichonephila clavipes]|nr:uncharacterized protein TNCV_339801 [Trichonephila clavipes]
MSHRFILSCSIEAQLIIPVPCVPIVMTARPNSNYLVSIEWMRYQRQWVPYRIFFASPFDNTQVEIRCSLESMQSFSYQDIVKNLKHSHSLMEKDESWDHNDIVQVPQEELEQFIKFHLLFGMRELRMGFEDWSHGYSHLHVFGSDHSRGNAICWERTPGRNSPGHDETFPLDGGRTRKCVINFMRAANLHCYKKVQEQQILLSTWGSSWLSMLQSSSPNLDWGVWQPVLSSLGSPSIVAD